LANNKTKQVKEGLLSLLKDSTPVPLEIISTRYGDDFDALAGALSSLVEKEQIQIGRLKTRRGWLLAESGEPVDGPVTWQKERGPMRGALSKILKELRKTAPPDDGGVDDPELAGRLEGLLGDGRPRALAEILAETGLSNVPREMLQRFPQLPDNRYTLSDSTGAWEYLKMMLDEKPRRLPDLLRRFHRHKEITDSLTAEGDASPFIRLPHAMVATRDSREGQAELLSRSLLKQWDEALKSLDGPFFQPEELGLDLQAFREIAGRYALPVEFQGEKYWCLRQEYPGDVLVDQIGEISGRYFAPPYRASAPAFLKDSSVGERESSGILGIDQEILAFLLRSKSFDYFILDGRVRIWRSEIEELKGSKKLQELVKPYEKVNIPEAAAALGLPIEKMRRLIDDGYISPTKKDVKTGASYLLYSNQVEDLRARLPEILAGWRQDNRRDEGLEESGQARGNLKKRPPRRKELQPFVRDEVVLDQFQIVSIEALRQDRSVLVAAPTGNGKTLVAEMLAEDLMNAGRGLVYTSPLKALSNQKYRDFREMFGEDKVGLVTGDISINPEAPLLVMTTEIFRNWCLSEPEQLEKTAFVIFDEIHYLDDAERGTTWEESILFAPSHMRILGLSATVPNVEEMADWIGSVRGEEIVIVKESKRHVPLTIRWVLPSGRIVREAEAQREVTELVEYAKALRNKRRWFEE
jgi:ATP-dependent RNA helicase HelY